MNRMNALHDSLATRATPFTMRVRWHRLMLCAALCGLTPFAWAAGETVSAGTDNAVRTFASDVVRAGDAGGRSFAVIDKPSATLMVFDGQGQLIARSPVLVGQAAGDVAPADIGTRPLSKVKRHEKVTSAGRYITEAGRNHKGEDIVWLDYNQALSMHRVRNVRGEARPHRLATPTIADNRISFGCVNIPPSFYDRYIAPNFSRQPGVVYVLPETQPTASVFPFATDAARQAVAQSSVGAAH